MVRLPFPQYKLEIRSDSVAGFTLGKPYTNKKGDNVLTQPLYYPCLSSALKGLIRHAIHNGPDITTIDDYIARVEAIWADIRTTVDVDNIVDATTETVKTAAYQPSPSTPFPSTAPRNTKDPRAIRDKVRRAQSVPKKPRVLVDITTGPPRQ